MEIDNFDDSFTLEEYNFLSKKYFLANPVNLEARETK